MGTKFQSVPYIPRISGWRIILRVFSDPEDGGDMFLRNVGLKLYGLHSVISQKMVLFIGN
jgi:hypothetical protein